eukprot:CAMPEP_0181210576 /NCGR_PEP_ID=MMETSP1096-20121128/23308_1 /TAXON_ID=156174 ORGANISM="Chrysochromulina ericina, Strain CCMP281" /NCGR_SAMPLE_ID=MMETSP1096 /ASSEMBLY_ACC=CAM_ASM_000453 /LENGTH=194 /DNA_ID=CAMNT_0023301883 /DNA_START=21 /DNA_END=605 /DNA_ORIENTATION=+
MDIDELLKSEQMLPCTILHEAPHLAWLDPTARQTLPLEAESKLSLLVESLQKRGHLELQMPEFYGNAYRQALRADAPHLDLRAQSDYYFDIGIHLSQILPGQTQLKQQLLDGFSARFHGMIGASLNASNLIDSSTINQKLCLRERAISDGGRAAARDFSKWRAEKAKIEQSSLIRRKRSRANQNVNQANINRGS